MPYIKPDYRIALTDALHAPPQSTGELNYLIHELLYLYTGTKGESYQTYNDIVGVLECVKLEVYRRKVAPYEDKKLSENGDIDFYK